MGLVARKALVLAVAVQIALLGCGDDEADPEPGDGGMDASTGGDPPAGDNGGTGGVVPQPPSPRFMCGDQTCLVPGEELLELFEMLGFPTGPTPFSPCCTEEDNACGLVVRDLDAGSMECIPRPPSDPECPDVDLFGVLQPSCCMEEMGMCGVNAAQIGAGCIDSTGGLGPIFGLEPIACGDSDGGLADAGE